MKTLKIQNVILIERAEIHFGPGLNILTGETGSGKSAILTAIRLISGDRADSQLIRQGADKAIVEAEFDGVWVRREIYRSGKNRCFIDDAQVSLAELKEKVQIEMVDQSSSILGQEKELLDLFMGLDLAPFEASVAEEKKVALELDKLLAIPKTRELEWAKKDLELFNEIDCKEEEKLLEEHEKLTHAQKIAGKIDWIASTIAETLPKLKKTIALLEACSRFDATLQVTAATMKGALLEIDEVERAVQRYDKIEPDPNRLEVVEKKMAAMTQLKRRFGDDLEGQKKKIEENISFLSNLDAEIESVTKIHTALLEKNRVWAKTITAQRQEAAPLFANLLLKELKSLNLSSAKFEIAVGERFNEIEFLFSANPGQAPISIAECASGGELSRLLLAIKTILGAGKLTLVFDEIDSNVGGQTASVLGEKLKILSEKRQIICVTHFVQVAKWASSHFLVSKEATGDSAFTRIQKLGEKEKEMEYNRMLGHIT